MLWLHGQLTPVPTMRDLLLPSLVSLVVPLALLQFGAPEFNGTSSPASVGSGTSDAAQQQQEEEDAKLALPSLSLSLNPASASGDKMDPEALAFEEASKRGPLVLAVGLCALVSVPAFKYLTGEGGLSTANAFGHRA